MSWLPATFALRDREDYDLGYDDASRNFAFRPEQDGVADSFMYEDGYTDAKANVPRRVF